MRHTLSRLLALGTLLLASCASRQIQIQTVAVPFQKPVSPATPERILAVAAGKDSLSRRWTCRVQDDGTFRLDTLKPHSYVSEYSAGLKPVAHDSRPVGVKIDGRLLLTPARPATLEFSLHQSDFLGNEQPAPGIDQPIFVTRSLKTSHLLRSKTPAWEFATEIPGHAPDGYHYYVLVKWQP